VTTREIGLGIGDRIGDGFEVAAAVPHATRDRTWIVVGRRDGTYATWTASREASGILPIPMEDYIGFTGVVDALADMLRRARS
jgi:hypothetical protein